MAQKAFSDERAFANPYSDYNGESYMHNNKISKEKRDTLLNEVLCHLKSLDSALQRGEINKKDYSMYTGLPGIALLKWRLSQSDLIPKDDKEKYCKETCDLVDSSLGHLSIKRLSFLAGDLGPVALGAVVAHERGDDARCNDLTSKLLSLSDRCCHDDTIPDELLYGRSGYLYALAFVRKYCGQEYIPDKDLEQVCAAIIDSGQKCSREEKSRSPLCYFWHDKKYIGAAHGYIGIMFTLLQPDMIKLGVVQKSLGDIKGCVDYLMARQFPSGNLPSSIGNDTDRLIHWCHGAPGAVHLFLRAYEVFNEDRYLEAAKKCGDVIWERGLLRRGYGLCHGVCGNAYGHLALYRTTKDDKYLHRAVKFADWCSDYGKHGCRVPDRPFSLFEGLAGTICFLLDLCAPLEARFPGFEL